MTDAPDTGPIELDATGLRCPLPVLRLEAALRRALPGQVLLIRTDDPIARVDVPHAARSRGHACELQSEADGVCVFAVTCGAQNAPGA